MSTAPPLPRLKSEQMVVNSPMSYVGSALRGWKLTHLADGVRNAWARYPLVCMLAFAAAAVILMWWVGVTGWYFVTIIVFGVLLIPFRLLRRGSRKRKIVAAQHRETLEEMRRH